MNKKEIVFSDLKTNLLSPGNIFWKKNHGEEILISKKGDLLNIELIEKIHNAKNKLLIEDEVDRKFLYEANELIKTYREKTFAKDMESIKKIMFEFLFDHFIKANRTEFEFNLVCWSWFSSLSHEEGANFLEMDRDYFIRSMSVASGLTILAIVFGFYDYKYLQNFYTKTMRDFKALLEDKLAMSAKETLEEYRTGEIDAESFVLKFNLKRQMTLFENKNGTGAFAIKANEMSEFDLVCAEVNSAYDYQYCEENFLMKLKDKKMNLDERFDEAIRSVLFKKLEPVAA